MRLSAFLAAFVVLAGSAAAHAATFTAGTYNFSSTAQSGTSGEAPESFSGTITINSSGVVTGVDLSFVDTAKPAEDLTFDVVDTAMNPSAVQTGTSGPANYFAVYSSTSGASGQFEVFYDASSPSTFTVCTSAAVTTGCPSYADSYLQIYNGYSANPAGPSGSASSYLSNASISAQSAPTVTPEPSSLILLGTGLMGMAGAVRGRFSRS